MESFDHLTLSLVYITLANNFQQLQPYQQSEYLEVIQDEYADLLQISDDRPVDLLDETEHQLILKILHLFYNYTESTHLATKVERYVFSLLEHKPVCVEWLITFGRVLQEYMNDVSSSYELNM
jgi:hypothetical protein